MARFILITGLVGSGKSEVAKLLRKKHYIVIDSDSEAKKLYEDPEVYHEIVQGLGPWILDQEGHIDTGKLANVFLDTPHKDSKKRRIVTGAVLWKFLQQTVERYSDSKEVIFVEAALTPEISWCRSYLGIDDVILVKASDAVRRARLEGRPGGGVHALLGETQSEKYLNLYISDMMPITQLDPPDRLIELENNGTAEALNAKLMEILEKGLDITDEEKSVLYLRYLQRSPQYCRANAWCYSFYNVGGCNECPFPCAQKDPGFKEANRRFLEARATPV